MSIFAVVHSRDNKYKFFLHTQFLENETQINKNNLGTMIFMSKQVRLPKTSLILQKMKIGQKKRYTPFLHESLQLLQCSTWFLTHELCMHNTSYRELWENVSLDRPIRCKLYANEVCTRLSIKLLSNLN